MIHYSVQLKPWVCSDFPCVGNHLDQSCVRSDIESGNIHKLGKENKKRLLIYWHSKASETQT